MKRIVSVLTAFIIAAYCVALSLFVLSVIRAYSHAVPHISPQALADATRIPLFIVLPATVAAVILAFVTGRGTPRTEEADVHEVSDDDVTPPEQDIPATASEPSTPSMSTPDSAAAIPQAAAIVAADAATDLDESPSPKPLEWHLPTPASSSYDEADEGTEKVVTTYEITPDDDEETAVITRAKDEATSTDDGKASIPVIASEHPQVEATQSSPDTPDNIGGALIDTALKENEVSEPVPEPPPEALSGSEALAQFSEAAAEESPLEAALSHKLVSAAADERDLSLVLIESDALGDGQSQEILDEAFSQHEIFEHGHNTYAIVKVGMTLDEALSAAEKVYNALPHDNGQCAIGISSRAIRLIGPATLLREAVAALERAKTEDTPIMAFRADTDKYRATLLSS